MKKIIFIIIIFILNGCSKKEYVDYQCDFNSSKGSVLIRYYNDGRLDYSDNENNTNGFKVVNNDKLLSFQIKSFDNVLFQFQIDKDKKNYLRFWSTKYDADWKWWTKWENIGKCEEL